MDSQTVDRFTTQVAAFSTRARRVVAHSLVKDADLLERIAGGATIVRRTSGKLSIERALPREEPLESLAARVRPLTLQSEHIHYAKALKAINALLAHAGQHQHQDWTRQLETEWKSVDPKTGTPTYFHQTWGESTPPTEATDSALTLAWFYGDLVHADDQDSHTGTVFPIEERFSAAAIRTAQLATLTRDTLNWITWLVDNDSLDIAVLGDPEEHVVVTPSKTQELVAIYTGEATDEASLAPGADPVTIGMTPNGGPWNETTEDGQWVITIPWGSD
ncbi:MAG: hypothetical protein EON52_00040 [Actinomycetales bacterium]|nr:MAG: hypothetical protein EON52_00040 [Actinomycetales bacterium]